jgi:hypothetical protein
MTTKYGASDEFVSWAESLSGLLTTIDTKYGGAECMLERADWDESRTEYALQLVRDLRVHLQRLEEEMVSHVQGKFS